MTATTELREYRILAVDESGNWEEALQEACGKIFTLFVYDPSDVIMCDGEETYWMLPFEAAALYQPSDWESAYDSLQAVIDLLVTSDQGVGGPLRVTLELDLDAVGGSVPATFFEGFESGMGIFGIHNMDSFVPADGTVVEGIPGLGGNGGSLANSDGYRCSYADPDYVNAFTYEDPDCFMGQDAAHADETWWEIISERAFEGIGSVHYGIYQDDM